MAPQQFGEDLACRGFDLLACLLEDISEWFRLVPDHGPILDVDGRLLAALARSEIRVQITDRIHDHQYAKLLLNSSFDPVAALTGKTYGEIFAHPPSRKLFLRLLGEGLNATRNIAPALAPVQGISPKNLYRILSSPLLGRLVARIAAKEAAAVESAMLHDVQHGRATEIDVHNGHLLKLGEREHLQMPTHRLIMEAVRQLEDGTRCGAAEFHFLSGELT